ncbi:hypothetical protein HMPREF9440_01286 [Sutterella parvirubra YIT 11816]|uniref:Uncharacterized protein n=1 Tax=Sutterella parvirubra YIT 11816 TaxID=762967 RepID=H3KEX1_9BURK|nr:hypothetical protein HMPREF9440_01286 [Sutterella parvirubra YIT 11816]
MWPAGGRQSRDFGFDRKRTQAGAGAQVFARQSWALMGDEVPKLLQEASPGKTG